MNLNYNILLIFIFIIFFFLLFTCEIKFKCKNSKIYESFSNSIDTDSIANLSDVTNQIINNGSLNNINELQADNIKLGDIDIDTFISNVVNSVLPKGLIVAWAGKIPPKKWAICNGENGTPDLRDKFIYGWGWYEIGTTGGEKEVTLNISQMPSHSHRFTSWADDEGYCGSGICGAKGSDRITDNKRIDSTIEGSLIKIHETGGNKPHNNMPPYYTLAFIMKIE